jgi:glycosyltransferase involved in cell wall biosynthesis
MKILITTEQYYPIKSGVSSVVTSIAEQLVQVGHEVYVATSFEHRKELIQNGVAIIEFKVYGGFGNYYRGEVQKYKDFIQNFECDVMINECVQTWGTDLILKELQNLKAKKIFLHSHGFSLLAYKTKNPWAYIKGKFYYWTLHKYLKKYDHIFLLHEKTVETPYLKKYNITNFSYLPNGVNENFIVKENINKKEHYLINISNYFPMKNQEFLLEAYYKSDTKYPLILIGNSILKDYLSRLKKLKIGFDQKYGFKKVEFKYQISRNETEKYLENATLFLHSSKLEVFPMVIVESMAKGIPFISTDVGNVNDLQGGIVVQTIDDMAMMINKFLLDKNIYNKYSNEGLILIKEELAWKVLVKVLEKQF